jgi:type IV pilus assembly protein PilM
MIALNRNRLFPIGLHLGPRSATLVQLAGSRDSLCVHAMAHAALTDDENASPEEQDASVASTLRKLIADHHFKGQQVISCLGSQELFVQNVRLPQLPPEEVEKVVCWEAEERLPYAVADAEVRHLLAGQVRQDANTKQEVILLACHRGVVERHVGILEQAKLVPAAIDVEPIAVLRSLRPAKADGPAPNRCAYLNLQDKATTVIFAEDDRVLFLKYIAGGGHQLDLAVSRHLDLSLPEAARMRSAITSSATLDADDEVHRSVIDAIQGPLESMGSEIELCFRYYKVTFRGKPLEKVVVTGEEASPWLADFLSERLAVPCEMGNPYHSLSRWPTSTSTLERPWRWTTAMGLSMKPDYFKNQFS